MILSYGVVQMIIVKNLDFRIDSFHLHVPHLEIRDDFSVLMGANGSGKTLLIYAILGLISLSEKTIIKVLGIDYSDPRVKKKISYLPQYSFMESWIKTRDQIRFYSKLLSSSYGQTGIYDRIMELIDLLDVNKDELNKKFLALSGGTRRKIEIAIALAVDAELYILDEPLENLDPEAREKVVSLLLTIKKNGKKIFVSSHYEEDSSVADDVIFMYSGKVISRIKPSQIGRIVKNVTIVILSKMNKDAYDFFSKFNRYYLNAERGECIIFEESIDEVREKINSSSIKNYVVGLYEKKPTIRDAYLYLVSSGV